MTRWLALAWMCAFGAAPETAWAATFERIDVEPRPAGPSLDFRVVREPKLGPRPIHDSGMIAQTQVSPTATIGIGVFKSSQRRPDAGEWRLEGRSPNSRKAAVRFLLRF